MACPLTLQRLLPLGKQHRRQSFRWQSSQTVGMRWKHYDKDPRSKQEICKSSVLQDVVQRILCNAMLGVAIISSNKSKASSLISSTSSSSWRDISFFPILWASTSLGVHVVANAMLAIVSIWKGEPHQDDAHVWRERIYPGVTTLCLPVLDMMHRSLWVPDLARQAGLVPVAMLSSAVYSMHGDFSGCIPFFCRFGKDHGFRWHGRWVVQ